MFNSLCTFADKMCCDRDVYELCSIIMPEKDAVLQTEPFSAVDLYIELRNALLNIL